MTSSTGERLRQARDAAGMTLDDVNHELRLRLPKSMQFSRATIGRVEKLGEVDPFVVAILADIYGVDFKATFPEAHADLNSVRDLLIRQSGWLPGCAEHVAA